MLIKESGAGKGRIGDNYMRIGSKSHALNKALAGMGLSGNGIAEALIDGVIEPQILMFREKETIERLVSVTVWDEEIAACVAYEKSWATKVPHTRGRGKSICYFAYCDDTTIIRDAPGRVSMELPAVIDDKFVFAQRHDMGSWEIYVDDRYIASCGHCLRTAIKELSPAKNVTHYELGLVKRYINNIPIKPSTTYKKVVPGKNGTQVIDCPKFTIVHKGHHIYWIPKLSY